MIILEQKLNIHRVQIGDPSQIGCFWLNSGIGVKVDRGIVMALGVGCRFE